MKRNILTITLAALVGAVTISFVFQASNKEPAFTTVHHFNLQPTEEARLLIVFQEFNQLFSRLGYPNVQYRLWKSTEGDTVRHSHRWDSVWPDRASYDKVHQDETYKKLHEKHRAYLEGILKDHLYSRFTEVLPGAKGK